MGATMDGTRPDLLIVDDAPENIDVLRAILGGDYRVRAATDGETTLRIASGLRRPDLILLDLMMPGMTGFETCRRLKADPTTRMIPVIFVTSRDDPADESEGFAAGAVDYIHKPANPHVVRARVRTHLELKAARERLEAQNEILRENVRLREEVEAIGRHDLKNPLTAILFAAGFLARAPEVTEKHRQILRTVIDAGQKMLDMINRSVDLFKMEQGTYRVQARPVDALAVIKRLVEAQEDKAAARQVGIEIVSEPAGPAEQPFVVNAEELLLYSMFGNLIANAVEASPPRGRVTIRVARGGEPTVVIHNAGCIPEAIRGRFMEKLATSGKQGGTGLGAYSAKLIAKTLGGTIDYTTSESEGTTLTVRLPA
jgi:two-component system, sensor histidine kinase and response regulator